MLAVPTLNCTFATAVLSEAVAVRETDEPETVAPPDGDVKDTDGEAVSGVGDIEFPPPPKPGVYPLPGEAGWIMLVPGKQVSPTGGEQLGSGIGAGVFVGAAEFALDVELEFWFNEITDILARVRGPKKPVAGRPLAAWNCSNAW